MNNTQTLMNWSTVGPELWLLAAACIVLLVDLFSDHPERAPTFWTTQLGIAVYAALRLSSWAAGRTIYGMKGLVVVDPMGDLLAFFAALAVMLTLAYARPTLASRQML